MLDDDNCDRDNTFSFASTMFSALLIFNSFNPHYSMRQVLLLSHYRWGNWAEKWELALFYMVNGVKVSSRPGHLVPQSAPHCSVNISQDRLGVAKMWMS